MRVLCCNFTFSPCFFVCFSCFVFVVFVIVIIMSQLVGSQPGGLSRFANGKCPRMSQLFPERFLPFLEVTSRRRAARYFCLVIFVNLCLEKSFILRNNGWLLLFIWAYHNRLTKIGSTTSKKDPCPRFHSCWF